MIELAPSVVCADLLRLGDILGELEAAGVNRLHFDVMDGHFVPNLTFGALSWETARRATKLPGDAHLMVANPDESLERYLGTGIDWISVHVEAATHLHRCVEQIKASGAQAGVALNPATPLTALEEILPDLDYVLLMTVNPGFSRQSYIPTMTDKIARLREQLDARKLTAKIMLDGGLNASTIPEAVAAGADVLVAGGATFRDGVPLRDSVAELREAIQRGLERRAKP